MDNGNEWFFGWCIAIVNALIKYPLFFAKTFFAIFLPSLQSIWKLQSLAIASYDMFDGEAFVFLSPFIDQNVRNKFYIWAGFVWEKYEESNKRANMRWIMGGFIVYNSYQNINMICSLELIPRKHGPLGKILQHLKTTLRPFIFLLFLPSSYSTNLGRAGGSGRYLMISLLEIQYYGIPDKGLGGWQGSIIYHNYCTGGEGKELCLKLCFSKQTCWD